MKYLFSLKKMPSWKNESGYTLLELLVVLAILAMIAGIAVPQVLNSLDRAKEDTARVQIKALSTGLEFYNLDVGTYPSEKEGLKALISPPVNVARWNGPYIRNKEGLIDPWGRPYKYVFPGQDGLPEISVQEGGE